MAGLKRTIIRGGLELLYFTGAHVALRPFVGGVGAILTLHHVRPPRPDRFQPNRLLEVTPRFLTRVVRMLRRSGFDLVSLDEMHRRMTERDFSRRFVCLTFDDGYRDTLQWAYPILKDARVPFAVYVPTSFPDRLGELWWLALEAVIARNDRIGLAIDGRDRKFDCAHGRRQAYALRRALLVAARPLRRKPNCAAWSVIWPPAIMSISRRFASELCMSWQELAELAADPLVTIGAHTVNHPMLAKLPRRSVRSEMDLSRSVIEAALGAAARSICPIRSATAARPARANSRSRPSSASRPP